MGLTATSGPFLGYGITQASSGGQVTEYNEERGPSLFDLGSGMTDPRPQFMYQPGNPVGYKIPAFFDNRAQIDYIPFAISSQAISASAGTVPTAGTALTLTPLSTLGAIRTTIVAPETGQTVSVIAIDSTAATLAFGQAGTVALWNPAAGTGRTISITTSSSGDAGGYTVFGRDMYGFKMQELIPSSSVTLTGTGKKAFKYISSILAATTTTSTGVGIGFGDTFGMPIRLNYLTQDLSLALSTGFTTVNSLTPATTTNTVTAATAATQTSTTGDVRGTWTSSVATTGTSGTIASGLAVRIQIVQRITPTMASAITASDQTILFGQAQFSSA